MKLNMTCVWHTAGKIHHNGEQCSLIGWNFYFLTSPHSMGTSIPWYFDLRVAPDLCKLRGKSWNLSGSFVAQKWEGVQANSTASPAWGEWFYLVIQTSCLKFKIKVMSLDSFHLCTTAWVSCKVSCEPGSCNFNHLKFFVRNVRFRSS